MFKLLRQALFLMPPEAAHEWSLEGLKLGHGLGATRLARCAETLPVKVMGLQFDNPVGLAAGLDKNGDFIDALGGLGFGFLEIGTVTPRPQPGNPQPRVFRIPAATALINRLGFNNKGVDHLVKQAAKRQFSGPLGINIGKNFDTPNERATEDYLHCLKAVYPLADYITINISSPNTKGLRELQGASELDGLLAALTGLRKQLTRESGRRVPIALKIAPDQPDGATRMIAQAVNRHEIEAVIATNTTIDHQEVLQYPYGEEQGGLSGAPVFQRSNEVLAELRQELAEGVSLIGVGGITRGADAAEKVRLGADLVQFYTGFIYRGPALIGESVREIAAQQKP